MTATVKGRSRPGVATLAIVVILVVVVAVAGAGVYVFVLTGPSTGSSTTPTVTIGNASSVTNGHTSTVTVGPSTSTGTQGYENYKGTFVYANPLGPFGINDSSGKPVEWNSTLSASGSFTFSINPATYIGSGSGQGSITVATHGYCTGTATVQYTFSITVAHPPGENMIISFNTPAPSSVMVQLTCQGPTTGFNTANNPVTFLSVYPNGLSLASVPSTSSQTPTGGISYTVTVTQAS